MSKKLLLADDSITIQKVIGITFANEDYSLSVVDNGDAALEKARALQPDLVLADVFMPGKNGYELCAALKADAALQQIPVLLLAGTFEPFDEAKARKSGADGWIAKPFESQALIDRVEELLARPRPAAIAPASVPAAAPVMTAPSMVEEDAEPDLWAELGPVEAPSLASLDAKAEPLPETAAAQGGGLEDAGGIDDLWGEVSLGEEDLVPVATASGNDLWADLDLPAVSAADVTPEPAVGPADDLWDDLAPPAAPPVEGPAAFSPEEEEEVFLTLEDEEEVVDLLEPTVEDEEAFIFVEDDELAEDLSEAAAQPLEDATTFAAAEPAEEELLELDDSDIMPLDDADIVEEELEILEEPLELVEAASSPAVAMDSAQSEASFADLEFDEPPLVEEDGLELLEEEEVAAEPAQEPIAEPMALEEAFDGLIPDDLASMAADSAELSADEPASLLVDSQMEEEPLWDVVEPSMTETAPSQLEELLELEPETELAAAGAAIAPAMASAQTAAVEAQVQGLSEADLARIVERVAGEVIERLAGTILERMAWEVVPDLAESLIREEIRKIRDNVG